MVSNFDGGGGFNSLVLTQTGGTRRTSDTYSVGPNPGEGTDVIVGAQRHADRLFPEPGPGPRQRPCHHRNRQRHAGRQRHQLCPGARRRHLGADTTGLVTVDNQESYEFSQQDRTWSSTARPAATRSTSTTRRRPPGLTGSITVNGGDPTASDTLIANGTAAADTIDFHARRAADAGTITGAGPVPITFATIENVVINGQGGGDSLTVTTPAGMQLVTVTPGALADEGQVTLRNSTGLGGGALRASRSPISAPPAA